MSHLAVHDASEIIVVLCSRLSFQGCLHCTPVNTSDSTQPFESHQSTAVSSLASDEFLSQSPQLAILESSDHDYSQILMSIWLLFLELGLSGFLCLKVMGYPDGNFKHGLGI